jgi:hypothetical protein
MQKLLCTHENCIIIHYIKRYVKRCINNLIDKQNKRFTVIKVFHNVFLCIVRTHEYHKFTLNVIYHRSAVHFNRLIEIHALRVVLTLDRLDKLFLR